MGEFIFSNAKSNPDMQRDPSEPIPGAAAQLLADEYMTNPLTVYCNGNYLPLEGFRFDAPDINDMLNVQGHTITHLYFAFGTRIVDGKRFLTIIAAPVAQDATKPNGKILTNKMYDFCEPCPDKCPSK